MKAGCFKYRQFTQRSNGPIPREDVQYGVSKRMPLLPRVYAVLVERALLFGEGDYPIRKFVRSDLLRLLMMPVTFSTVENS